jgi:hypothetical protein
MTREFVANSLGKALDRRGLGQDFRGRLTLLRCYHDVHVTVIGVRHRAVELMVVSRSITEP